MAEPKRTRSAERTKGAVVLVAEDLAEERVHLADSLAREGFGVIEACNGPEAVARACSLQPDAIVMDVCLPGMDGTAAARIIHSTERMRDVPIIALTARPMRTVDQGVFDAVLQKPCTPHVLAQRIRDAIVRRARVRMDKK